MDITWKEVMIVNELRALELFCTPGKDVIIWNANNTRSSIRKVCRIISSLNVATVETQYPLLVSSCPNYSERVCAFCI